MLAVSIVVALVVVLMLLLLLLLLLILLSWASVVGVHGVATVSANKTASATTELALHIVLGRVIGARL